jgi:hypothetical protein
MSPTKITPTAEPMVQIKPLDGPPLRVSKRTGPLPLVLGISTPRVANGLVPVPAGPVLLVASLGNGLLVVVLIVFLILEFLIPYYKIKNLIWIVNI